MKKIKHHAFAGGQEEQGVALIVSLLALSVVTLLGLALTGTHVYPVVSASPIMLGSVFAWCLGTIRLLRISL